MTDNTQAIVPQNGCTLATRTVTGDQSIQQTGETASAAVAAQSEAMIRAHYGLALQRPRDINDARDRILRACERPRFARAARYEVPMGGQKVKGLSIRFAEEAMRAWTNMHVGTQVVCDDATKRIVRVTVTDFESNLSLSDEAEVEKTVERSDPKDSRVLSTRQNSAGKVVYVIPATEAQLRAKQGAEVSKTMRNLVLRLLPADILEDATDQIAETVAKRNAIDPAAAVKEILDSFAELHVKPSEIKVHLGHEVEQSTPAEIADLWLLHTAIKDGATTWGEATRKEEKKPDFTAEALEHSFAVSSLRDRLAAVQGPEHKDALASILADIQALPEAARAILRPEYGAASKRTKVAPAEQEREPGSEG